MTQTPHSKIPDLDFPETWLDRGIIDRFDHVADTLPEHTALFNMQNHISFAELQSDSCRLAHVLQDQLGDSSQTVAILQENDLDCITSILAVLRAGKRYIILDPNTPASTHMDFLRHGETRFLLRDSRTEPLVTGSEMGSLPGLNIVSLEAENCRTRLDFTSGPDSDAAIFYTSGTTGTPKGVLKSHKNFMYRAYVDYLFYEITPADRICSLFHNQHSASIGSIFTALLNGASYTPFDPHIHGLDSLGEYMARKQITILRPPLAAMRAYFSSAAQPTHVPHMRYFSLGGDVLDKQQIQSYHRFFLGNYILAHQYSLSEAGAIARHNMDRQTRLDREAVPLSTILPLMEVRILDEDRRDVPVGEIGEIALRSEFLSTGYWRNPELTAQRFQADPDGKGRIYFSGDYGYFDSEGTLYFAGRKDEQVKIRGHRVNLRVIETILQKFSGLHHPRAAVYKEPVGDVSLVVCYLQQEDSLLDQREIRRKLREQLPDWMIPSHFIGFESYPVNRTGKIDQNRLQQQISMHLETTAAPHPGPTNIEAALINIWEKYLNISPISPQDDFFDLGGHSLAGIQILDAVEKAYGRKLPVGALLEIRTIQNLAAVLSENRPASGLVVPIQTTGEKPPLFFAPGITGDVFYLRNLLPYLSNQPLYGLQPPGMDNSQSPLTSIPEIAAELIRALKTIQSEGPYYLAGHSFGGYYVYEMASQLISLGEKVNLLAVLDTYSPTVRLSAPPLVRANLHIQNLRGKSPRAVKEYLQTRFKNIRLKLLRYPGFQRVFKLFGYTPEDVRSANKIAKHDYELRDYPGKITFFCISDRPAYLRINPAENWSEIAADFELIQMPGQHGTMLDEPYVRTLGEELERLMGVSETVCK